MAELITYRQTLGQVRIASLKAYLRARSYVRREKWGPYLERYSRKSGGREEHVIIPTKREIDDFERRLIEAIDSLARQTREPVEQIIRKLINSGYEVVRIRVSEGADVTTLSYDVAVDLLHAGYTLIDSSAVTAMSTVSLPIVRGRRPDVVRRYLDGVRVGQTEVGSFVLTLLLPLGVEAGDLDLPETLDETFGSRVAEQFTGALRTAEEAVHGDSLRSSGALSQRGLTANFSGGIAQMLEAAGDVTISLSHRHGATDPKLLASRFSAADASRFRDIERRLTPTEEEEPFTVTGAITEFREPRGRTNGSIIVATNVHGETRPVRINFRREDRATVVEAIEKKADVFLTVDGDLLSKGGHYRLENAEGFRLTPRGPLA